MVFVLEARSCEVLTSSIKYKPSNIDNPQILSKEAFSTLISLGRQLASQWYGAKRKSFRSGQRCLLKSSSFHWLWFGRFVSADLWLWLDRRDDWLLSYEQWRVEPVSKCPSTVVRYWARATWETYNTSNLRAGYRRASLLLAQSKVRDV